jgi:hypothetical protein
MYKIFINAAFIVVVCFISACDYYLLDLTTGKVTINEVNGAKSGGPFIIVDGESKAYRVGDNIYDGTNYGANGNNNSCLDPGETIRYKLRVRNVGKDDAIAVHAVISTSDPWVTDLQNTNHYIRFIKGDRWSSEYVGTYYIQDNLLLSITNNTPRGHKLNFNINFTDESGNSWRDYFIIIVH